VRLAFDFSTRMLVVWLVSEDEPPGELPGEVLVLAERVMESDEPIVRFLLSDIDEEGNFGERWLVITTNRVVAVNRSTKHVCEVPMALVRSAEARDYVGNGELVVETPVGEKQLIRFSRRYVEDFRKAAVFISAMAREELTVNGRSILDEDYWVKRKEYAKSKVLRWLLSYLKPNWHYLALSLVFAIVTVALSLVPARLMGTLVDEVFPTSSSPLGNSSLLVLVVLGLLGAYASNSVLGVARNYTLAYLGQKVTYSLRVSFYRHLQLMSLSFYDKFSSGRIMQRLVSDTETVQWFLSWGMQSLIVSLFQIAGIGFMIFTINTRLALMSLLPVPVILIGWPLFRRRSRRIYHRNWRKRADMSSLLWSTVPGTIVVKTFVKYSTRISTRQSLISCSSRPSVS